MKKLTLALLLLTLVPMSARAQHCQNKIYVFSYHADLAVAYTPGVVCLIAPEEEADARFIEPGADAVQVRYAADVDADHPTLVATLNGLGFVDHQVTLTRFAVAVPNVATVYMYDGPVVAIPDGPLAMGCLRVDVALPEEVATNVHRTVGATCP